MGEGERDLMPRLRAGNINAAMLSMRRRTALGARRANTALHRAPGLRCVLRLHRKARRSELTAVPGHRWRRQTGGRFYLLLCRACLRGTQCDADVQSAEALPASKGRAWRYAEIR